MELESSRYRSDDTHDLIQMVAVERDHSYFLKVSDMSDDYVEVSRTRPCVNAGIPAGPSNNCATASDDHESDSVEILSEFETEDIKLDVNSVVALNCNNTKSNGEVKVNEEKIPKIQDILFVDVSNLDDDDDDFEPPVFNRSDLINEVQTDNNELVKCDFCNQSISSKNLQTHMDAVHNGVRPYKCHVCGKAFGKKKLLDRHTSGVHEKIRNFLCGECQKSFTQKCDLKRHVLEVHQDFRAHKCPLCPNAYKKSSTLALHIAKVHGHDENKTDDDDAPTTNCTKTNAIKTAVVKVNNAQQSQSIDDKVVVVGEFYSCDECDKKYILKRALLDHVRSAHANKLVETLRCSICESSSFADRQALEAHLRSAHDQGVKPHTCRHCPKAYGRRHQLKQHVEASHLGLRPHECPECGKRFGLKLGVTRHISEVHRGLKPYSCELCPDEGRRPSSFRQSGQLREHVDTAHRGIRRFECADCGKRFGKKPHLRVHLLTVHLGHRAHKCAHCSKAFGQIGDLKKHVDAIHRRVKPHACDQCDRSYTQKSHLTHHVNVVHFGVKPHLCPVCCKAFSSRTVMRRHFEAMHKGLVLEELEKNRVTLEELEKCDL